MEILNGITNVLTFLNNNWTAIIIVIGLACSLYKKADSYLKKSLDEKIEIAKQQISETMLKRVTQAESDYLQWVSAGGVKRAQVIDEIFATYPVLSKVTNQKELIEWLDDSIDEALKDMREIFAVNAKTINESVATNNVVINV